MYFSAPKIPPPTAATPAMEPMVIPAIAPDESPPDDTVIVGVVAVVVGEVCVLCVLCVLCAVPPVVDEPVSVGTPVDGDTSVVPV